MEDRINLDFIRPFIDATHSIFEMMMGRKVRRKEVYFKKNHVMFGDITGVVGVSGKICGTTAVSLPATAAIDCIATMIGEDVPQEMTERVVHDGVGEIINMITGSAKTALSSTPLKIECTLPTIISGRGHELYHREGVCNLSLVFETEKGEEFALDVCMEA